MIVPQRKIAAFSLRRTVGLLNSAAYAQAARDNSNLVYQRFSDNSVMNAITVAITGEPGFAEVEQNARAIEVRRQKLFGHLVAKAAGAIRAGPHSFVGFLGAAQRGRDENLRAVQSMFQLAANIDARIAGDLRTAIRTCAAIQFGSTIFLAATPVGLTFAGASASTAFAAGMIGFGYSVTKSLVKDIAEARNASVIAFDLSKDVGKKGGDEAAGRVAEKAMQRIEGQKELMAEAEEKIAQLSRDVARKVSSKKIAKLTRQMGRAEGAVADAERSIKFAKYGQYAARSLQVVFAAHDIYEGWEDFEKAWSDH